MVARGAQGAWCFLVTPTFVSSAPRKRVPTEGRPSWQECWLTALVKDAGSRGGSPGPGALAPQLRHGSHGPQAQPPGVAATDQPRPQAQQHS